MLSKKLSLLVLPLVTMVSLQANDPFLNDPFGDDIFKEMYQMQKEMDKIFERMQQRVNQRTQRVPFPTRQSLLSSSHMQNMTHLEDKGSYYEYNTHIPENKNNQLDINIEEGVLHIKARVETVTKTNQSNMQMQQRSMRMFQSSESLPDDVDIDTLKGSYKKGEFVLTIDKKKKSSSQSVKNPTVEKKKEEQTQDKSVETKKIEEPKETNATRIKVPETSSHA